MANLRGLTLPIVDLSHAIEKRRLPENNNNLVIITKFNRLTQGFLVSAVNSIEICNWSDVLPPPKATTSKSYLSGIIQKDEELIGILDVERVLDEVLGTDQDLEAIQKIDASEFFREGQNVLVVDDSSVALKQISRTLNEINIPHITANDGREALDILNEQVAKSGANITETIPMVISDLEMPEMDGYTLVRNIRKSPALAELYVLVHTSLNGSINADLAQKAGANEILEKFVPEELVSSVIQGLMDSNNN